ncbi:MAG: hypothetical protein AAFN07_15345, partial [Pseudomonadota bacterium]
MFKQIRIFILLAILLFVALNAWLTQLRSTDWNNSLWIRVYPINADGHANTDRYIASLSERSFGDVEDFLQREVQRYGVSLEQPVRIELGPQLDQQPPRMPDTPNVLDVMWWSLKMRWWVGDVTDGLEPIEPDVRVFVRYHNPADFVLLEDSVGVRKGMYGIVNAYAARQYRGSNNVILAHEFLHTIGASDKYDPSNSQPLAPIGLAEPDRQPLYPQRFAEIMGGRIALSATDARIPGSLQQVVIGPETALEIGLIESLD